MNLSNLLIYSTIITFILNVLLIRIINRNKVKYVLKIRGFSLFIFLVFSIVPIVSHVFSLIFSIDVFMDNISNKKNKNIINRFFNLDK